MKLEVSKKDLRMRRRGYSQLEWRLVSPVPEGKSKLSRWNIVWFVFLAFLVLGMFVAAAPR